MKFGRVGSRQKYSRKPIAYCSLCVTHHRTKNELVPHIRYPAVPATQHVNSIFVYGSGTLYFGTGESKFLPWQTTALLISRRLRLHQPSSIWCGHTNPSRWEMHGPMLLRCLWTASHIHAVRAGSACARLQPAAARANVLL